MGSFGFGIGDLVGLQQLAFASDGLGTFSSKQFVS